MLLCSVGEDVRPRADHFIVVKIPDVVLLSERSLPLPETIQAKNW